MHLFIILLGVFVALPVSGYAQQYTFETTCEKLTEAKESADYKPGVDVNGNEVVSADLNNNKIKSYIYPIEIPVEIQALKLMDLPVTPELQEALYSTTKIAHVTVYEDGRIEYNGVDISGSVSHRCLDAEEEAQVKDIMAKVSRAHRQNSDDDLGSLPDIAPAAGEDITEDIEKIVDE